MVRWRLATSLFSFQTGVLGTSGSHASQNLPPSDAHLLRCAKEVRNFSYLLKSHAMDPLPSNDSILVKLIHRAIDLDTQRFAVEKMWSRSDIFCRQINREDEKLTFMTWHESEYKTKNTSADYLAKRLLADYNCDENQDRSLFRLTCHSSILQNCLLFISSWILRVPNKKARWSRLQDSFSFLVKGLASSFKSNSGNGQLKGDDFSTLFSFTNNKQSKESNIILRKREAAATIIVGIIHSCTKLEAENNSKISLPIGSFTISSCKQVSTTIICDAFSSFYSYSHLSEYDSFGRSYQIKE
jgi:hypothetical protein